MHIQIILEECPTYTQYVPLAILGYCLTHTQFLQPVWDELTWTMKTRDHTPVQKLQDMLVSMMAGNKCVSQINTHLRPDRLLAMAWHRQQFAEQSTIAKLLDRLTPTHLAQLRQGSQRLFCRQSQTIQHDFEQAWLLLDIDLTGLRASKRAEGSCKGYFSGQRNQYGRQLVRVSVPTYHETILSQLYPGNQGGSSTLKPAMTRVQEFLNLEHEQRQRTIIRTDAGLGTDENVNWALWAQYQVLMKGYSGSRARSLALRLSENDWSKAPANGERWIAWAQNPPRFGKRLNVFVLRWPAKKTMHYGTLLSSLFQLTPGATWTLYDGRGAAEIEIKADKQGLRLPKRRKQSFAAQEGLILLTDLAHNILSWMHHWVLEKTSFADFGTERIVDELLCIPGHVDFKDGKLHKVALLKTHPYADEMRLILQNLLDFFDIP